MPSGRTLVTRAADSHVVPRNQKGESVREARILIESVETFYHVSNEIKPSLLGFTENEQAELEYFIFDAANFCQIEIIAYTVYPQGYVMLVKTPAPYDVSGDILEKQVKSYLRTPQRLIYKRLRNNMKSERLNELKERIRDKLFNLREFVILFASRFSLSYNKQHHRKGSVWEHRFKSYVVEKNVEFMMNAISYIHTRALVMNTKVDLSGLRYSSWTKALEGSQKWRKKYNSVIEARNWKFVKMKMDSMFIVMTKRKNIPNYGSVDQALVENVV
ncbi:MAG: hypothetical protein HKP58_08710 [Desulfatitalea sp.]|nr:hypothetical protein [Desulfatitalea sp.]NNK00479.1 hypothetical protein [Desulfatitalea sp.]